MSHLDEFPLNMSKSLISLYGLKNWFLPVPLKVAMLFKCLGAIFTYILHVADKTLKTKLWNKNYQGSSVLS